jgi:DNA polymerase III sliding clamp (beta) subunit (PCNA family)
MTTSVTFDTATFNEAIQRAARVAPSRGAAFDKAGGILIEVWPGEQFPVVIKATNLDVYYTNWLEAIVTGERTTWRVPSATLAAVAASLPTANGARVTLENEGRHLILKQKPKLKARLNLMPADLYPIWNAFDPDDLTDVHNLGAALARVEWAAAETSDVILNGIRFNGKDLVATDRWRIATVEMKVPVEETFVLKSRVLTPVLPPSTSVKIGFDDSHMLVMPNEETQIKVVMMEGGYPNIDPIMQRDKPDKVRVSKARFIELIQRALTVRGADRTPLLRLFLGKGELAVMLKNADYGSMGDVIETPGYCDHPRVELTFGPENVLAALNSAPGDDIEIGYDRNEPEKPIHLKGSQTYEAWIAVRGKPSEE